MTSTAVTGTARAAAVTEALALDGPRPARANVSPPSRLMANPMAVSNGTDSQRVWPV